MQESLESRPLPGSAAAAIARAIVQLLHEYTGRGPTRARTHIDEDLVTVVLQDTLTMGERSLVRDGKIELVLAMRKAFQDTMASKMVAAVEEHTGRRVHAFLSANNVEPDTAVECFVLVPRNLEDGRAPMQELDSDA